MRLIAEKYRKLSPQKSYLTDEVIITHAWKKTHSYIRHHNWYADTLALDISALGLEKNVEIWARELAAKEVALHETELVPAAKSEQWKIDKGLGWVSCREANRETDKLPLRPLAHLTVRDQVWAQHS